MLEESRLNYIEQLKEIKKNYPDLKIVVTDVKEGAEAFGLIPDEFDDTKLASHQTLRLLRYGHLHNSSSGDSDSIQDLN
jgi:isopenicillin N synthase-like dioxygenase